MPRKRITKKAVDPVSVRFDRSSSIGADLAQIDLSGVTPVTDTVAAEVHRENLAKKEALLGYAKLDYLNTDMEYGRWNLREIDLTEVKKFVMSMRTGKGLVRYAEDTVVLIAIEKSAVDIDSLSAQLDMGSDTLKELNLLDEDATIIAAGRQHRRAALEVFRDEYVTEITALEKKIKGTRDAAVAAPLISEVKALKAQLAGLGYWGVAVYDYGESLSPFYSTASSM